jgi:hypothetical protein
MERLARMDGPDKPPLPQGYPDPDTVGWARTDDLEVHDLHIRMTITPGERIVQLWDLQDGHPVRWFGNAFRLESEPPVLYLNYRYDPLLTRSQRDQLARTAAKFWKG